MDRLLLNPDTAAQLRAYISRPGQTLLISAPEGSGKLTLAKATAARVLGIDAIKLGSYAHFYFIAPPTGKQDIPIDRIRQLIKDLSLQVPSVNTGFTRAVLIDEAHRLSLEAQNALLKLLEEPPQATILILTTIDEKRLLPTVVSRTQIIRLIPPGLSESVAFFNNHSPAEVEAGWRLSRGSIGLLLSVLEDEKHPLKFSVALAKEFIGGNHYSRLLLLQSVARDATEIDSFLNALSLSLAALQSNNSNLDSKVRTRRLVAARRLVIGIIGKKADNTNLKLLYLELCLNFHL